MNEQPGVATVLETTSRKQCMDARLVLDSAGIPARAMQRGGHWVLVVSESDLTSATEELNEYRQENSSASAAHVEPIPIYGGAAAGVIAYSIVIIVIFIQTAHSAFGFDWQTAGENQVGRVIAGELWRTVTALTLHVDVGHILGNLVFGILFGFLAGQVLGGGVAWLAIVLAGALGNLINAMVQAPTHTSIGASTAVFAALGIIVAHAIRPRASAQEKPLRRWSPIIGGVLLLAFIGVGGERTDVLAHITGFGAGLLIGWLGCRLPDGRLASQRVQKTAGAAAIGIVIIAWLAALFAKG